MVEKVALEHILSLVSIITPLLHILISFTDLLFFPPPHGATAPSGPGPPHYRGFTITLRHTKTHTLGWSPQDEWPGRRRDLYLTTHNTHKRDIHAPGGFRKPNPIRRAAADPRLRPSPTIDAT